MAEFNGHRSWNAWNVNLWLSNDYVLYNYCMKCIKDAKGNIRVATNRLYKELPERTPDGAVYNKLSIKEFLRSFEGVE